MRVARVTDSSELFGKTESLNCSNSVNGGGSVGRIIGNLRLWSPSTLLVHES